jgi:hypothetical protein
MTAAELRRRRAAAQLLAGSPPLDPASGVAHLLAVQAQDLRAARLALRARGAARSAGQIDAALTEERALVVGWLMRGTLHLVAREDHGWLLGLTSGQNAATTRRRLGQLGVDPNAAERAVGLIERALDDGPLARPEIAARLLVAGIPARGQAVPHLLALAAGRGVVVLGPVRDGTQCFARARDWLGRPAAAPARETALAELARRYLRGHGPATAADLAAWSGLGLRDARAGLNAIAGELRRSGDLVDLIRRDDPPGRLPPKLLPAFDPYLLGWSDRSFAVAPADARRVHPGGGILRPTALANGRAVGTWTARAGRVTIDPFGPLAPTVDAALAREAADVARF